MDCITKTLVERLVGKGMEISSIPNYLKILAITLSANAPLSLQELNMRLESLGWDDFELDNHTLQLVMAVFENYDSRESEIRRGL
jgi:hypothetical protein